MPAEELRFQWQDAVLAGDHESELALARRMLANTPDDPRVRMSECSALAALGRPGEARAVAGRFPAPERDVLLAAVENAGVQYSRALELCPGHDEVPGGWRLRALGAAALRTLKPWIMTPEAQTEADLRARLDEMLAALARGHLGELPRCPPEPAVRRLAGAGLSALRLVATTFLPAVLVVTYRLAGLEESIAPVPALVDVITLAVWPTLSLLVRLDPEFLKNIGVTRQLSADLLPRSGSGAAGSGTSG
ncbi:hypothetical protein KIH74_24155 [Kineosporia sp. J2-2]|uniref:Tetratricopeptide repeat protein n=1 Tax=Kineosporia corallincola TaxID=2835133 RepID=A0ABS5TMI7_9ACTN|nr:hypothetical protein [Kineosporia corallincola]MBT0772058.1 hypothetical protein [Kineosporia corallincola]